MTYELIEVSTEDGRPVELYEFERDGTYYRYTSADVTITYLTNDYEPVFINRSAIGQNEELTKGGLTVEMSRENSFASGFLTYGQDFVTSLNIYRDHYNDGDWQLYWKGQVNAAAASGSVVTLECESIQGLLSRNGLRQKYTIQCRHTLYDNNCTVDKDSFKEAATVDSVSGTAITFALDTPDAAKLVDYFQGGFVETSSGAKRFIQAQSSNVVTISYPFDSLSASDSIFIYAGCQHRFTEDCVNKFSNGDNYGGNIYYPTDDGPFAGRSIA